MNMLFLGRRRDLLNNSTIKNCDKIEKFQKLITILVKSLKMRRRFESTMGEMKTNINVKELLGDTKNIKKIRK